jgi:hypothetical protein
LADPLGFDHSLPRLALINCSSVGTISEDNKTFAYYYFPKTFDVFLTPGPHFDADILICAVSGNDASCVDKQWYGTRHRRQQNLSRVPGPLACPRYPQQKMAPPPRALAVAASECSSPQPLALTTVLLLDTSHAYYSLHVHTKIYCTLVTFVTSAVVIKVCTPEAMERTHIM